MGRSFSQNQQAGNPPRSAFTTTVVNIDTTTEQLVAANPKRTYLHFQNSDANLVHINMGTGDATAAHTSIAASGGTWQPQTAVPTNAIQAISITAASDVIVIEGTEA